MSAQQQQDIDGQGKPEKDVCHEATIRKDKSSERVAEESILLRTEKIGWKRKHVGTQSRFACMQTVARPPWRMVKELESSCGEQGKVLYTEPSWA